MTDNPTDTAAGTLGALPDKPFSPAAPAPAMSFQEAESRKAEMFGNQEWVDKYMSGDIEARAQYDAVIRSLAFGRQPPPSDPRSVDQLEEWARSQADVSEAVIEQIRTGPPITPLERRLAIQRREARFADPEFVQAYLDGNPAARKEVLLLSVILSSRVRDDPSKP
jgi:hypothetical protein